MNRNQLFFVSTEWIKNLIVYSLVFNLAWTVVGHGTLTLTRLLSLSQMDYAFQAFAAFVVTVPIFIVGHLIIQSKTNLETVFRAAVAGAFIASHPWDLLHLRDILAGLSLDWIFFSLKLNKGMNFHAMTMLLTLMADLLAVGCLHCVLRYLATPGEALETKAAT